MFSHSSFFFFFSIQTIFINKNDLFEWIPTLSQPRSLSQCSNQLQHLIRTSPIGTRGVSRTWLRVRNTSLFTHSLFVVYYLYSYIHLCFFNFLILLLFFYFNLKQIFINNNELFEWIQTLSQPRSLSQCSNQLQHLNKYCVVLVGKNQKVRLLAHFHHTHVSSAATQDQKV